MRFFRRFLIALLPFLLALTAQAADEPRKHEIPAGMARPVPVHLVVRVLDILKVEETAGEATVSLEMQQRWRDPTQAFDPLSFGRNRLDFSGSEATERLETLWTPAVTIENMDSEAKATLTALSLHSGGDVVLTRRIEGKFRFSADLSAFPFDRQVVPFAFVSHYFPADDVIFVIGDQDRRQSTVPEALNASDWKAGDMRFTAGQFHGWSARPFARMTAAIDMDRKWPRYFLRIFVPFMAVLSVSLFILWTPEGLIGDKPGVTYSALLALAALSFTFEASFPGSMSVTSPIAFMISIGYFYLILALVVDLLLKSQRLPGRRRFPFLPQEARVAMRCLLPALFTIVCICITLRSLA